MKSFTTTFSEYVQPTDILILGVSGGVDSMVLLDLVCKNHSRDKIIIAHFDHALRGAESDGDRELVRDIALEMGVVFEYEKKDIGSIARDEKSSLEAVARRERYYFLENILIKYGARYILTAHHSDDQAETILMNLIKGGKVYGLSGMSIISGSISEKSNDKLDSIKTAQNPQSLRDSSFTKELTGTIFRPLLSASKQDIRQYAQEYTIRYREDSSNQDTDYERNKIRQDIMPLIRVMNPSIEETISELGSYMQDLSHYMNMQVKNWLSLASENSGKPESFMIPEFVSESGYFQKEILTYLYREAHTGSTQGLSRGLLDELRRFILEGSNSHGIKEVRSLRLERRGERVYYSRTST